MNNFYGYNNFNNSNNSNNSDNPNKQLATRPKTMVIDARFKEIYYRPEVTETQESRDTLTQRHNFWNYMMQVSMQNTVSQMINRNKAFA